MTGVRLDSQEGTDWGTFSVEYKEKEHHFPCYIPTGEIFNHDPMMLIRFKCVVLTCLTPVVSLIRSIYWFANSFFLVLSETYRYLDGQSPPADAHMTIGESAYESARALGYGALMTGAAFSGIFDPYQGRLHYGWLEREFNHHSDGPHRDKFYLAICFQRLFVLGEESENSDQAAEKITHYLARIDAIRAALWSCACHQLMVELRMARPAAT